jgi:hypothetical protein
MLRLRQRIAVAPSDFAQHDREFCAAELLGPQSVISAERLLNNPCKPHIRFRSSPRVEVGSAPSLGYSGNRTSLLPGSGRAA